MEHLSSDVHESGYASQDDLNGMSERVQNLASSVYKGFERLIGQYGEESVKELMPMVVGILEFLNQSQLDREEKTAEIERIRADHTDLLTQYEHERQLKRSAEEHAHELADMIEEERQKHDEKNCSLESLVRLLELKSKASAEQVARLEEKEADVTTAYNQLHARYNDLFRNHAEYVERSQLLLEYKCEDRTRHSSSDAAHDIKQTSCPSVPQSNSHIEVLSDCESNSDNMSDSANNMTVPPETEATKDPADIPPLSRTFNQIVHSDNLATELSVAVAATLQTSDAVSPIETKVNHTLLQLRHSTEHDVEPSCRLRSAVIPSFTHIDSQDLECDDMNAISAESADIISVPKEPNLSMASETTDARASSTTTPKTSNSEAFDLTVTRKEIEQLIMENAELLSTKNALNVVKDDLISQVDQLNTEAVMAQGEVAMLKSLRERHEAKILELEQKVSTLEGELKTKEPPKPCPFTRAEMGRVLMERNAYKEKLIELQEAVKWANMVRVAKECEDADLRRDASRQAPTSVWNLFGSLLGGTSSSSSGQSSSSSGHMVLSCRHLARRTPTGGARAPSVRRSPESIITTSNASRRAE